MNDTRKMHKIELKTIKCELFQSERKTSFNKAQKCVLKIFNGHIKEGEVNVINNEGHHFIQQQQQQYHTKHVRKHCKKERYNIFNGTYDSETLLFRPLLLWLSRYCCFLLLFLLLLLLLLQFYCWRWCVWRVWKRTRSQFICWDYFISNLCKKSYVDVYTMSAQHTHWKILKLSKALGQKKIW